jgi:DNA polymerase-4
VERHIVHLEVADFYAVLEQLRDSRLNRGPLAIAELGARSVVQGINDWARREGIQEGMALTHARRLCRGLQVVAPDVSFYRQQHQKIVQELDRFSPLVEGVLPGHYFVDLTGTRRLWGAPPDTACLLEKKLDQSRRLQARVGLARNKLISQVAAHCVGTGDLGYVFSGSEDAFLRPLPVRMLPGIGPKTEAGLADLSITRVGQLAALPSAMLAAVFGKAGSRLAKLAHGDDSSPVIPFQKAPRLRLSRTLDEDEIDRDRLDRILFGQVEDAGWILRRHNRCPQVVELEIRYADGVSARSREKSPAGRFPLDRFLFETARRLLHRLFRRRVALRRLSLEFSGFSMPFRQLPLFPLEQREIHREEQLQSALDIIRLRFGRKSIIRGPWPLNPDP